jgi:hypothetical protein
MENNQEVIKFNATLEWANLTSPNEMSGKYQVDLCCLSDKAAKALESMGLAVRSREDKPEKGNYITCKSTNIIRATMQDGADVDTLVGNGSKGTATVGFYDWSFKGKKGRSPSLKKLVITELVSFDAQDDYDTDEAL